MWAVSLLNPGESSETLAGQAGGGGGAGSGDNEGAGGDIRLRGTVRSWTASAGIAFIWVFERSSVN